MRCFIRFSLISLVMFIFANGGNLFAQELVGKTEFISLSTSHPYVSTMPYEVVESFEVKKEAATFIKVHFTNVSLNAGDHIAIRDAQGILRQIIAQADAGKNEFWSHAIDGAVARIYLISGTTAKKAYGFDIDQYGYGIAPVFTESMCGSDDKVAIECVSGTTQYQRAQSVGRMLYRNDSDANWYLCTGFLISPQHHFLTNDHCVNSQTEVNSLDVRFHYQYTTCEDSVLSQYATYYGDTFIISNYYYDFSLMTLSGNPAATYGYLELNPRDVVFNETVYIPQHPGGRPKEYGEGPVVDEVADGFTSNSDFGYQVDTEGGSSGSPVLSMSDHKVVGIHHLGGCTSQGGQNQGVLMKHIYPLILSYLSNDLLMNVDLMTPCRIVDTRITGGYFIPGERREYFVYGIDVSNQGGNAEGCCPRCSEPKGAIINVTAVPVSGSGYFTVFPADVEPPLASIINYRAANGPVANAATIQTYHMSGEREIEFLNGVGYSHLVVDVMGYLY